MNIPPFFGPSYEDGQRNSFDFTNLMHDTSSRQQVVFDPELFRMMLDDPAQRGNFAARFPTAKAMFEEYLEVSRPTFPEFPSEGITALQLTLFDNGEPQPRPSKAKRPRERTAPLLMRSRYGLTAKAWDRLDVDWGKKHHLAWSANAFLWSAADALTNCQNLVAKKQITPSTAETLRDSIEATYPDILFSIFSQREPGCGSRWTDIVVAVDMFESFPRSAFFLRTAKSGYIATNFDVCTARGGPLGGKAIAQARLPLCQKFERWGTEPVPTG